MASQIFGELFKKRCWRHFNLLSCQNYLITHTPIYAWYTDFLRENKTEAVIAQYDWLLSLK